MRYIQQLYFPFRYAFKISRLKITIYNGKYFSLISCYFSLISCHPCVGRKKTATCLKCRSSLLRANNISFRIIETDKLTVTAGLANHHRFPSRIESSFRRSNPPQLAHEGGQSKRVDNMADIRWNTVWRHNWPKRTRSSIRGCVSSYSSHEITRRTLERERVRSKNRFSASPAEFAKSSMNSTSDATHRPSRDLVTGTRHRFAAAITPIFDSAATSRRWRTWRTHTDATSEPLSFIGYDFVMNSVATDNWFICFGRANKRSRAYRESMRSR